MLVDVKHGRCRSCGGQLEIVDLDDCSMSVECTDPACGDSYEVEPDAFGDGCMIYFFEMMSEHMENGGDD